MRILLVSQYFLPQPLANAEVIGGLAQALGARGHEVTVVSPVPGATASPGVVHRKALGRFARDRKSIPARLVEYGAFTAGALGTGLRAPRPDVIVVPSPPLSLGLVGAVLAARHRAPLVYNVQDLYPEVADAVGTPGALRRVMQLLARLVYRRSDAIVVIDPGFEPIIRRACPGAVVRSVRNGIDTEPFTGAARDDDWLRQIGVRPDRRVVMYAGNIGRSQDLVPVIEAAGAAGADLVVHGGGAGLDDLQALVAQQGHDHVHFSGYVDRSRLGTVFASADVHVVPLKPGIAWASVPSKLLSIFSAGRPVVLAAELDSPAAAVVEEAGGGWTVEPGHPDALADAVAHALAHPDELTARGASALRWAATTADTSRMAAEWESVLDATIADSPGGPRP